MSPEAIQLHPSDNVAIVVAAGGTIPQGHKIALADIAAGAAVVRYGQTIGLATAPIAAGSWVNEELLALPAPPPLDALPLATAVPNEPEPIPGITFDGYANPDGTAGTRNLLAIVTTVQCVAPTVEHAVERIRREILPRYANVDGVVPITHGYGCGVAINVAEAEIPIRTIRNLGRNPNFGGEPLLVGLGCEKLQPERLYELEQPLRMQEQAGFQAMVAELMRAAERRLAELNQRRRIPCPASQLTVGVQCGGSDAFSGVTANPAVGHAADLLVKAGATVLFSEVTEVRDAIHLLTPRAATREVGEALVREMAWYDAYLARGGADRSANPTPGNKRGGLSTIVEKALGSIAKAGTTAIRGVVRPGERACGPGLVFAATPASDFLCGTLQMAAGMNVHVFTTGAGTPYGLAAVPVIKVASRTELARRWPDVVDVDAGRIATGAAGIEQVGRELFEMILATASGRHRPWAERWGLANDLVLFNPGPVT